MTNGSQTTKTRLLTNNSGLSTIEFALILPVFLLLCLGVIEFGLYFVKEEIADDAISSISLALQRDPTAFNQPPAQLNALVKSYGSGLVNFSPIGSNTGNYICVDAYLTQTQALNVAPCNNTHFNTANPNGANSTAAYFISVRANLKKGTVTPLGNFIPVVKNIQIAQSTGAVQINPAYPPTCPPGEILQSNGTGFICVDMGANPQKCSQPWQKMVWNGTSFDCINVPYVMAGGIVNPTNPGSGVWIGDQTYVNGSTTWHYTYALCQKGVTFAIPTGLPITGQIIPQGNLIYPVGSGGNGDWHAWTVSFLNVNAPITGGTGRMDVCMDNGGNWGNDQSTNIGAEHVSWSVIFIP
jgi:Flp pilus assembly protein TadG